METKVVMVEPRAKECQAGGAVLPLRDSGPQNCKSAACSHCIGAHFFHGGNMKLTEGSSPITEWLSLTSAIFDLSPS